MKANGFSLLELIIVLAIS
ncbi:MAG: prepilin-type N-terminal cleavage/methylation domain-containing protein, partial [Aquificaceae bacterium]